MSLSQRISEYFRLEAALQGAMTAPSTARVRGDLLRRCADALDRIESFVCTDRAELQDKIYFFMQRAVSRPGVSIDGRDVNIALALSRQMDQVSWPANRNAEHMDLKGAEALIGYVGTAPERVSMIASDYRYIATSPVNAAFYQSRRARIVGSHLADLIGEDRFENRAKAHLDACLGGEPQEYYHTLSDDTSDNRLMRCQMKPVPDSVLGRVALVYMREVTGEISVPQERLRA